MTGSKLMISALVLLTILTVTPTIPRRMQEAENIVPPGRRSKARPMMPSPRLPFSGKTLSWSQAKAAVGTALGVCLSLPGNLGENLT